MKKLQLPLAVALAASAVPAVASDAISGGFWVNHTIGNDDPDEVTYGDTNFETLIFYIDHTDDATGWKFSSEVRFGSGAFADPENNNTGGEWGFHKAWIGKDFEAGSVKIGKSAVPFGFKTINFWPGDELIGGYGDQMDVGVKWSSDVSKFHYDVAYYHVDDFGDSTASMDDGFHWGSKITYQKGQTAVLNGSYEFMEGQEIGVSYQTGKLRDLAGNDDRPYKGDHSAAVAYYEGTFGALGVKAQYITTERDLNGLTAASSAAGTPYLTNGDKIKNDRKSVTVSYAMNDFLFYVDYTNAESKTSDYKDGVGSTDSWAPGMSYDYGPGWVYVEYLSNDGGVNSDGMITDSNYDAWYFTIDYYF